MKRFILTAALAFLSFVHADFIDEFSDSLLDPGWRVENEDSAYWSLTANPGNLRILTRLFETQPVNFFCHVEAISGDYSVSVKLTARADSAGQIAMLYCDYDSLGWMPPAIVGYGNYLGLATVVFSQINDTLTGHPYADTVVFLRLRAGGDTIFAEYSPDSVSWDVVGRSWSPLFHDVQRTGVMAVNHPDMGSTPETPSMKVDYDWFRLTALSGVEERAVRTVEPIKAWPNPFRNETRFTIHDAGCKRTALRIYDASGQEVRTLLLPNNNSQLPAIIWDGTDQPGRELPAGVYFIQSDVIGAGASRVVKIR